MKKYTIIVSALLLSLLLCAPTVAKATNRTEGIRPPANPVEQQPEQPQEQTTPQAGENNQLPNSDTSLPVESGNKTEPGTPNTGSGETVPQIGNTPSPVPSDDNKDIPEPPVDVSVGLEEGDFETEVAVEDTEEVSPPPSQQPLAPLADGSVLFYVIIALVAAAAVIVAIVVYRRKKR